jgi:hypothetical protein
MKTFPATTFIAIAFSLQAFNAMAQKTEFRAEAIKNWASGYALVTLCAANGFAKTDGVAELGELYRKRLSLSAYENWRDIYQTSLHQKKIYTIAGGKWVSFSVDKENCKTVDGAVAIYIQKLQNQ